jgi:glycosyltransferase involved in cell wall biosynthesis
VISQPILAFSNQDIDQSIVRQPLSFTSTISILYVGKPIQAKGFDQLLQNLSTFLDQYDCSISLFVAGDSSLLSNNARTTLNMLQRKYCFTFQLLGFIGNPSVISSIYASTQILVVPSLLSEGYPRVLDEAAIFSLPVLVSLNISECLSTPLHSSLYLYNPLSDESFALALKSLVFSYSIPEKSGFSIPSAAHQHLEVIKLSI